MQRVSHTFQLSLSLSLSPNEMKECELMLNSTYSFHPGPPSLLLRFLQLWTVNLDLHWESNDESAYGFLEAGYAAMHPVTGI